MEKCIICKKAQNAGIHLYTSFICAGCEQEIIHTETDDPRYKYFVEQMRVIKETKIVT
ncbi:sigma factor G inhibitor Gin [Siminovitchia fortis]|uniref:Carnitine--CoA ligase n=1 Tax=Siminovitchia fortis TaxID=254758 RepID=A0A443IMP5_9BACI|nr:sigma factor G inhibitor Gin [Siminovitchia fortis]RWR07166.1 carnitine--CoA ligase [Siminovitchia fortis]WHY81354.1 sigma factor G inhibitor Gin [Siminovitchia fortis]